jgi:hypothetical protein
LLWMRSRSEAEAEADNDTKQQRERAGRTAKQRRRGWLQKRTKG